MNLNIRDNRASYGQLVKIYQFFKKCHTKFKENCKNNYEMILIGNHLVVFDKRTITLDDYSSGVFDPILYGEITFNYSNPRNKTFLYRDGHEDKLHHPKSGDAERWVNFTYHSSVFLENIKLILGVDSCA